MDAVQVALMGEFVKQAIPVCSVLGGFTLATALIENRGAPGSVRGMVVGLLSLSSVAFVCAVCASASYLYRFGLVDAWLEASGGTDPEFGGMSLSEVLDKALQNRQSGFEPLYWISVAGSTIGIGGVMGAIALSGFVRSRNHGLWTATVALVGSLVVMLCLTLPW